MFVISFGNENGPREGWRLEEHAQNSRGIKRPAENWRVPFSYWRRAAAPFALSREPG
jgi:hypothetical protein